MLIYFRSFMTSGGVFPHGHKEPDQLLAFHPLLKTVVCFLFRELPSHAQTPALICQDPHMVPCVSVAPWKWPMTQNCRAEELDDNSSGAEASSNNLWPPLLLYNPKLQGKTETSHPGLLPHPWNVQDPTELNVNLLPESETVCHDMQSFQRSHHEFLLVLCWDLCK